MKINLGNFTKRTQGTVIARAPTLLAVGHNTSPYITLYEVSSVPTFTKKTNPGTLPASAVNFTRFSADGERLCVRDSNNLRSYTVNPFVHTGVLSGLGGSPVNTQVVGFDYCSSSKAIIAENITVTTSGDTAGALVLLVDAATFESATTLLDVYSLYSTNISALFVDKTTFGTTSVRFLIRLDNNTWREIIFNPVAGSITSNSALTVSGTFNFIAVASENINRVFGVSGDVTAAAQYANIDYGADTFTAGTGPTVAGAQGAMLNADGTLALVGVYNETYSPGFRYWTWSAGNVFTAGTAPASYPLGNMQGAAFSNDNTMLALAYNSSPYIHIYDLVTMSKYSNPATLPTGRGNAVAIW